MSFYVNGIMAVVNEWLSGGCTETEEEISHVIINCIRPFTNNE